MTDVDMPAVRYAWRDDVSLAYQIAGTGPIDLVYLQGYLSNVELNWEHPALARFLRELAGLARLIVADRRGLGLSERFTPVDTPPTEVLVDDVAAVLDAAGSARPVIFATGDCGWMAMLYAATYPDRVSGLILYGTAATWKRTDDTPWGLTDEAVLRSAERVRDELGTGQWMLRANPSITANDWDIAWGARYERLSLTPGAVYTETIRFSQTDIRSILAFIQVPTLVLHRTGDTETEVAHARHLASKIRTAQLVELPGQDHFPWIGNQDAVLEQVRRFVVSVHSDEMVFNRVLSTVLFTDIVDSTSAAARLGDENWTRLIEAHNTVIRSLIARYQGKEINTTGDGFVAIFDSPARAIRCATGAVDAVHVLGLQIRAGCHTGEIELAGDDIRGVTVHAAGRIAAEAEPDEILVSGTVKELVAGSAFEFRDRARRTLKGLPNEWALYAVS